MKKVMCMAAGDFMFPASQISREKTKGILGQGHHFVNKKYMIMMNCWPISTLMMLDWVVNCKWVSIILFRMSSKDFRNLIYLVCSAVKKEKYCLFGNSIIVMECLAIMRYPCNWGFTSQHNAQPVLLIMPQVCEVQINTDTSFQFVELETRQKPFDHYCLVLGIRRVAGKHEHLMRPNCIVVHLLQICWKTWSLCFISVMYLFCQFSMNPA